MISDANNKIKNEALYPAKPSKKKQVYTTAAICTQYTKNTFCKFVKFFRRYNEFT